MITQDKPSLNNTLAEEKFIDQMERTLDNIIGYQNNHKQLLTQDLITIIEYDGLSKILTSNNLIFTEKQKSIYVYCIIRNSEIDELDFSHICSNNVVKKFQVFIMHKEQKVPQINGTDNITVNIITYNDLLY
jgi:hypothetical protein